MARRITAAARLAASSELPRLAVAPVALSGGADPQSADALARILAIHIIRGGKYAVYPRTASLEQIQEEYVNQFNGDTADENLPDIGRGTNPELALSVMARKLGSRNMFNAAIINLETGVQEAGETANYQSLDDGIGVMADLAALLGGRKRAWTVSDAVALNQAVSEINVDGEGNYTITLNRSFDADPPPQFTGGAAKTVTLKREGAGTHTITNSRSGTLFYVPAGVTLVLDDNVVLDGNKNGSGLVSVNGALVMKAGSTLRGCSSSGVYVGGGGSFTMSGGTISGNTASYDGGVYVGGGGSFTMSGGTISGNTVRDGGGGVWVSGGSFIMEGGTISGNTVSGGRIVTNGGGVWVRYGSFTMSGGTIRENTASSGGGGSFTMNEGTINGNTASSGGGVFVYNNGNFVKKGGGTIDATNRAKEGRVVYVHRDRGSWVRDSAAGPKDNLDSVLTTGQEVGSRQQLASKEARS